MPTADIHVAVRRDESVSPRAGQTLSKRTLSKLVLATGRSLLLAGLLSGTLALGQTTRPDAMPPLTHPLLDAVRATSDPSAAVEAYARCRAAGLDTVQLEQVFVRHMALLGEPELADVQAHDLIRRGAADATVRGIAAYNDAAHGKARAAIANLKPALAECPDDPFLLRTAGQMVAWYDSLKDRSNLSPDDVAAIESLRAAGKEWQAFVDAYRAATAAREQASSSSATAAQTSETPTTQRSSDEYYSNERSSNERSSSEDSSTETNGNTKYSYEYSYGYGYPYSYYPYYGSYSIITVPERNLDHRNPHHRDGSNDRGNGMSRRDKGHARDQGPLSASTGNRAGRAAARNEARVGPMSRTPAPAQGVRPSQGPASPHRAPAASHPRPAAPHPGPAAPRFP